MGDNGSTERLKAALTLFTDTVQRSELRDLQRRVATLEQQR
jgi:hypothetical protein